MTEKYEIIQKIKQFMGSNNVQDYYVGITGNPKARLAAHEVSDSNSLIYDAITVPNARVIEDYFIVLGTKGGTGGGDTDSHYVYCYKIGQHTKEHT